MRLFHLFGAFIISVCLGACGGADAYELQLPEASFSNKKQGVTKGPLHGVVKQVDPDSLLVQYGSDSVIVSIDSNLHYTLFEVIQRAHDEEMWFEPAFVDLYLQAELPYETFEQIGLELRKVNLQRLVLFTGDTTGITYRLLPYSKAREKGYIHPEVARNIAYPPEPPSADPVPYLQTNRLLFVSVLKGEVFFVDTEGDTISDYRAFITENRKILHVYRLEGTHTYQDFITLLDNVFSAYHQIRSEHRNVHGVDERTVRRTYPIRIVYEHLIDL